MVNRRQPSGAFLHRVNSYTESTKKPVSRIRRYKDSDAWLWTEVAAVVIGLIAIVPATIAYWIDWNDRKLQREAIRIDLEDRQTQRIAQAWELVTRVAPGNAGKGPALEYLNSQGIPLTGIDLSKDTNRGPSYLVGLNLSEAVLTNADLSGARLSGANLSNANLNNANLSGADLSLVNLSGASLVNVNLSGASLVNANLSEVNVMSADLAGAELMVADLSGAEYLFQYQLDTACGSARTQLPEGLTIKACPSPR